MYVVGAERCTWKFSDFQKTLHEKGAVRPLTGKENVILITLLQLVFPYMIAIIHDTLLSSIFVNPDVSFYLDFRIHEDV